MGKATTKLFEGIVGQIQGSSTGIDFAYIGNILLTLLGLYLISSLFSFIQGWIMTSVAMKITYGFRTSIAGKDQPAAAALLRRHQSGRSTFAHYQ